MPHFPEKNGNQKEKLMEIQVQFELASSNHPEFQQNIYRRKWQVAFKIKSHRG